MLIEYRGRGGGDNHVMHGRSPSGYRFGEGRGGGVFISCIAVVVVVVGRGGGAEASFYRI